MYVLNVVTLKLSLAMHVLAFSLHVCFYVCAECCNSQIELSNACTWKISYLVTCMFYVC